MRYTGIRRAGPYKVESCSDGMIKVTPDWPLYAKWNERDGGGPGLFSRLELAEEIQALLDSKTRAKR